MKIRITLAAYLLAIAGIKGQNPDARLILLQRENDSLRLELEKCKTGPFQALAQHPENSRFSETPVYSRAELHDKLLPQIRLKSPEKHAVALKIIEDTDRFLRYCTGLSTELIDRSGGFDSLNNRPVGGRDKKTVSVFFLEEKRGGELKSNILELRNRYLGVVRGNAYFQERIVLEAESLPPQTAAKSWEEYKFKGMPLAAILPVLGKYKADAVASEAAVLQDLND